MPLRALRRLGWFRVLLAAELLVALIRAMALLVALKADRFAEDRSRDR